LEQQELSDGLERDMIAQAPAAPLSAPFDGAAWDARRRVLDAEIEAMFRETDRLLAEVRHV